MREDLNKVMCESPRLGGGDFHDYRQHKKDYDDHYEDLDDDQPHKGDSSRGRAGIRTSKIYWNGRRRFNEHLNPLRGIIHKNVGRPWNKVYSELCSVFDKRSVINQHILIHLADYVKTTDIESIDGKLYYLEKNSYRSSRHGGNTSYDDRWVPIREAYIEWYVDPRNGLLQRNKGFQTWKQKRNQNRAQNQRKQDDQKQQFTNGVTIERNDKGIWFISKVVRNPGEWKTVEEQRMNHVTKVVETIKVQRLVYPPVRDWEGRLRTESHVTTVYKAMSAQELKKYGVENRYNDETDAISQARLKKIERRAKLKMK